MQAEKTMHQRPCPQVLIKDPAAGTIKRFFHTSKTPSLQSFSFSLSVDDIAGSFNLLFFPEHGGEQLFDEISILDVVEFYEDYPAIRRASGEEQVIVPVRPVFQGIIRSKKYAASGGDSGVMRRMSVSGTAITGLVSQFQISLDVTAQAARAIAPTNDAFNAWFAGIFEEKGNVEIKDIVLKAWELFLGLNSNTGNPEIADYIASWMGSPSSFFDIGSMEIGYPMAGIFQQQATQDFFSIVDNILPPPYYEKSAYADSQGNMKIRIRRCPFSAADWKAITPIKIDPARVKSFDVSMSDNEVYTFFLAYLEGSPLSEQEYLIIAMNEAKKDNAKRLNEAKFARYGYRPLVVHFRGYRQPDGGEDTASPDMMKGATEQIAAWYGNLDEMLSGSITLAMTYRTGGGRIMPGDVVEFMGHKFYVDGISHSWTYNGGGEINLSVSRGGIYDEEGNWSGHKGIAAFASIRGGKGESAG